MKHNFRSLTSIMWLALAAAPFMSGSDPTRPNILFCLGDNYSWLHLPPYGCNAIQAPNFGRIAREGVLFRNAFSCAPSCGQFITPS